MIARVSALALAAIVAVGCGEAQGPALQVSLQLVKANSTVDTSDLTGFVVIVGGARNVIPFSADATTTLELSAAPALSTPFVVYGCTSRAAACREVDATVLGCAVVDLSPSDTTQVVVVPLDAADPVPDVCLGVEGAPQTAG